MDHSSTDHLSNDELAAYLDRQLGQQRRDRVEAHLEACPTCREELAEVARLIDTAPPLAGPRRLGGVRPLWVGVALAAGLGAVVVARGGTGVGTGRGEPTRAADLAEGPSRLEVVTPKADSLVARAGLILSWHAAAAASLYRVIVLTEGGEPVWSAETEDTVLMVPAEVVLNEGETYFWRADGIGNGIVTSTGPRRVRVAH